MPIYAKVNNTLVEIKEVIAKIGGVLVRQSPLQAKINGLLVDFISYGYSISALINLSPVGFSSAMLASTINTLSSNGISVEVIFQNGTFLFDTYCNITSSNVTLKGSGNTILKCNGTIGGNALLNFVGKSGTELENIKISDLTIDGDYLTTGHTSFGIYCYYVGKGTLNFTTPYDATKIGYSIDNKVGITIKNCVVQGNTSSAVLLSTCFNCILEDNIIQNNKSYGVYLVSSSNVNISNNIVQNNGNYGIILYSDNSNNLISNNTIQNNVNGGIYLYIKSKNNTVSGNTIQNNTGNGIYLNNNVANNTISGNTVQNNNSYGVYLGSSSNNIILGNTIQNNNGSGIYLSSSNYNSTLGNTIQSNTGYGIHISSNSSTFNLIQGNIFLGNISGNVYDIGLSSLINHNTV